MTSLFTRIIAGELPSHRVLEDDVCVAFLTISPVTPGHTLVVPRAEVDHWLDADDDLLAHLTAVAKRIGAAQLAEFGGTRSGLVVQGYGVPHLHLHVFGTFSAADFRDLDAAPAPDAELAANALRLRERLAAA